MRRSGQSVTASDFGSNGPRFESGLGRCVESLDSLLPLSQGEAFTLASISYLAILVKYILAKERKERVHTNKIQSKSESPQRSAAVRKFNAYERSEAQGHENLVHTKFSGFTVSRYPDTSKRSLKGVFLGCMTFCTRTNGPYSPKGKMAAAYPPVVL